MAKTPLQVRRTALGLFLVLSWHLGTGGAHAEAKTPDVGAGGPAMEVPQKPCDSPPRWTLSGKVELQPGCVYTSTLSITESHTDLDCRGSVIDPGTLSGYALHIDSQGKELTQVTVRNCVIRNANAIGLVIGWRGSDQDKVARYTREEIYQRTPHDVRIINTRVDNAKGPGIYIDDYVSDVLLQRVTVTRSDAMAVYLEHSSRRITIEDSLFEDNSVGKQREALSIDSSADNVIRRNTFRRNKAGGIFLYKNCQEHAAEDPRQAVRWQGSDGNLIEANRFEDEPVGIWIASRQSRDLRNLRCGDPYYGDRYVLDKAAQNTVKDNVFLRVARGVLVEDDNNRVQDNRFEQTSEVCVRVGSGPRFNLLGRAVVGTQLSNNTCALNKAPSSPATLASDGIEFVHGAKAR